MTSNRLPGVDAFRLIGAVLVVGLHVGTFAEWPDALVQFSRASGRWVVPFFFLVMGFFIARQPSGGLNVNALTSARRLLKITMVSTVIYLLLRLGLKGPRETLLTLVSPEFFVRGIWLHLWFLHASLAGLIVLALRPQISGRMAGVMAAVVVVCSAIDSLFALHKIGWGTMFANRFVAGVCLALLGVWMARRPLFRPSVAVLAFVGGGGTCFDRASLVRPTLGRRSCGTAITAGRGDGSRRTVACRAEATFQSSSRNSSRLGATLCLGLVSAAPVAHRAAEARRCAARRCALARRGNPFSAGIDRCRTLFPRSESEIGWPMRCLLY